MNKGIQPITPKLLTILPPKYVNNNDKLSAVVTLLLLLGITVIYTHKNSLSKLSIIENKLRSWFKLFNAARLDKWRKAPLIKGYGGLHPSCKQAYPRKL
ncbi:hypothetical protein BGP75_16585 [Motiliproteus sp. MSK22-1]|nr:hypothetical protein BGP75_16585 [Motiliproteus sp. MSK22-1]